MRTAARTKGRRAAVSSSVSLPAPIGGWNARDSLTNMPISDAVMLDNWFPLATECMLRKGHTDHATGLPGLVDTLMAYSGSTTEELWAVSVGGFYDVTASGAVGAAAVSGLSNSRWQYCNVSTSGGNFMYTANGSDTPYLYNGSAWTSITAVSTPAITGVTTTNLNTPVVFKNRIFFIEEGTLKAWYLPTNAVGGAANPVDISAVVDLGGYIVDHSTWTIDAGQGVDDYYVLVTSKGEVVVYQGTDPSSSTTWAVRGVWRMGPPVGRRCLFKFAGDVLMLSHDGLIPLAEALQSSRVNPRVALTDKIQQAISQAVTTYGDNFGWQIIYVARDNMLYMNVPFEEGANQQQYVMNTITRAWARFNGQEANCWEVFQESPYFGGNGVVCKAWNAASDNGDDISASGLQAFSAYGAPGYRKRFTMIRPIFRSSGSPAVLGSMNIDFNLDISNAPLSFSVSAYAVWDVALWDVGLWGGDLSVIQNWQGVVGEGYYGAPQMQITSNGIDVRWVSTDVVYETGSIL